MSIEFYCAKTQRDRFEKKVEYTREIDAIVGKHIRFPLYKTNKHEYYIDTTNGNKFNYISCSLHELNDSDEVYVFYGSDAAFLGTSKKSLNDFIEEYGRRNTKHVIMLGLCAIAIVCFFGYMSR